MEYDKEILNMIIVNLIRTTRQKKNISYRKLSKGASVDLSVIYRIENDYKKDYTITTIRKLFNALQISFSQIDETYRNFK